MCDATVHSGTVPQCHSATVPQCHSAVLWSVRSAVITGLGPGSPIGILLSNLLATPPWNHPALKCNAVQQTMHCIAQSCSITTQQLSPSCKSEIGRRSQRQKLKWLHYQDALRPWYVATRSNLVFSINLAFLTKSNLVFCTTNTLWLPRTPSQTAFFTFFLCIFNLSRAILGAVWINLILPKMATCAYKSSVQPGRHQIKSQERQSR